MQLVAQEIEGVFLIHRSPFRDERGSFSRMFCAEELEQHGVKFKIDQINLSINASERTLRGFHIQRKPHPEAKILSVMRGEIFNVVLDLRKSSKTFLKTLSVQIREGSDLGLIVPEGCANAFLTLRPDTQVLYFMQGAYAAGSGFGVRYNDPALGVQWPAEPLVISEKDREAPLFDLKNWNE